MYRFLKKDILNEEKMEETKVIGAIEERQNEMISYDKMQRKPSISVKIKGKKFECLLDTGVRINVMSMNGFRRLRDINLVMKKDCNVQTIVLYRLSER